MLFLSNDTATTEIYTLSLHDALPICRDRDPRTARRLPRARPRRAPADGGRAPCVGAAWDPDRKSTRLNSSHANISYAVLCLKKKNVKKKDITDAAVTWNLDTTAHKVV